MLPPVSLYDAKTQLSALVDRAAAGEEIIIAKNGVPRARLVPIAFHGQPRKPANALGITRIAADFDTPDPAIERQFAGDPGVNLLLDTHVFLWWDQQAPALNPAARAAIADPRNNILISAASVWEIAIKRRLGKLDFAGSATAAIEANGFQQLPILPAHAEAAGNLAWDHPDLFDRMLVAQAIAGGLTLLTADRAIRSAPAVAQFWVG